MPVCVKRYEPGFSPVVYLLRCSRRLRC